MNGPGATAQTVINVPPSFAPSTINSGTIVNLLDGGTIGSLHATAGAEINILGGTGREISGAIGSLVNVAGGQVEALHVGGAGAVTGGAIIGMSIWNGGAATVSGGAMGTLGAHVGSSLNILGVDFSLNGVPLSGLVAPGDSILLNLTDGDSLTGRLADGIAWAHYQRPGAQATLIADGTLRLTRSATPAAPTPGVIEVSTDSTLASVGAGQTLRLLPGGRLPKQFRAGQASVVEVNGGYVNDGFHAIGADVIVDGGGVGHNFRAFDDTTVTLKSGIVNESHYYEGSTVNVEGGELVGTLYRGATMNVRGGTVVRSYTSDGATVNVDGGYLDDFSVGTGGIVNVRDGRFQKFGLYGAVANVAGGTYNDDFFDVRGGTDLTLGASEFRLNGVLLSNLDTVGSTRTVTLGPTDVLSGVFDDGAPFIFSGYEGRIDEPIKLTRSAGYAPGPASVNVPPNSAPRGLHAGQTLVLAAGGSLPENFSMTHGSAARVEGGTVGSNFEVIGATLDATGGTFNTIDVFTGGVANLGGTAQWSGVDAYEGATVNVTGGRYPGGDFFRLHDGAKLNVSGGEHGGAFEADDAEIVITDGTFGGVSASRSTVEIHGGRGSSNVALYDRSTLKVTGGSLGSISAGSGSTAEIENATVDGIQVAESSRVVINSGSVSATSSMYGGGPALSSRLELRGGALGDNHYWYQGVVELYGTDFQVDGQAINGLSAVGDSVQFTHIPGTAFTGVLADGTPFAIVPESDSQELFTTGGVVRLIRAAAPTLPSQVDVAAGATAYGATSGQTVTVQAGGKLAKNFTAGPGSVVEVIEGAVGDNFEADRSQVRFSGGAIGEKLDVFDGAVVEVAGGNVGKFWEVYAGGTLNVTDGSLGSQGKVRGGTLNVSGGAVGSTIEVLDHSVVNVSGGVLDNHMTIKSGSTVSVTGGKVGTSLVIESTSSAYVGGGQVRGLQLLQGSAGEIEDGIVDSITVNSGASAQVRGGAFGDGFNAYGTANVVLYGADFEINGVAIPGLVQAGDQITRSIANNSLFTGTLADGTPFAFDSRESDGLGTVTLKWAPPAAAPPVIDVSTPAAPLGVRAAQQLNLRGGGKLGDSFQVGRGAELNIHHGVVGKNLEAFAAAVNIYGGEVGSDLDAFAGARVRVEGGTIGSNFDLYGGATLDFQGGYAADVDALVGSTVIMGGGKIRDFSMQGGAVDVDWSGGVIGAMSNFSGSGSTVDIFGVAFERNGAPIAGLGTVGASVPFNLAVGDTLTGVLADGTPLVLRNLSGALPNGMIRLNRSAAPTANLPSLQQVVDDQAPFAIGAGQTLVLDGAGRLGDGFIAGTGSKLVVRSGQVGAELNAFGGEVRVLGGVVKGNVSFYESVNADIFGGQFEGTTPLITAGSDVTIYGKEFFLNNVPIAGLATPGSSLVLGQRAGQMLKAILADGSILQWRLQLPTTGGRGGPMAGISTNSILRLQAIPEPAAIMVAAVGLAIVATCSRKPRQRVRRS